jgi:hypothetical protein
VNIKGKVAVSAYICPALMCLSQRTGIPLNFGTALVPLRGILNTGVVMVAGMGGACIVKFGKVNRRVISCLHGDRAVVGTGSVGTGRVGIGALHLSGEGSQVGFSEVKGDTVDGVSIEMNGIRESRWWLGVRSSSSSLKVYSGVSGVSCQVWDGPASTSSSISSNTW